MNKLATIVPVLGIGARNSGLTLIDDNESSVKSLSAGVVVVPVGVVCASYKNTPPPVNSILSVVAFFSSKIVIS